MRTILCYGDSNTWGSVPGSDTERYGPDVRWPRVMAAQLGGDLDVYEAGMGGRTTVSIVRSSWGYGPETGRAPLPLLVAPHVVGPLGPDDAILSPGAVERSRELGPAYDALSTRLRCDFLDLAPVVEPSPRDPWHWEPEGHAAAAGAIAEVVRRILPRRD